MKHFAIATLGAALVAGTASLPVTAQEQFMTIGTGGQTGVYYVVGQSICRLVNRANENIKCTAPSTGGSVANLNAIMAGEMGMGVAQSDQQYNAYNGAGPFADSGAFEGLRAVFSVHPEPFTVIARADAGIETFDDLKGKRVNIGNPGSGQRATMDEILAAKGWTTADFQLASELKAAEQSQALCDNKIDAMVYVVGHPNGSIEEATTSCDAVVVSVSGPEIDALIEEHPYYAKAVIPGGMYTGTDEDVETFGVRATFVSSTNTSPELIHATVSAVFENFDRFKRLHPAFESLNEEEMIKAGLSAPLHDGAAQYYQEKGWM